MGFTLPEEGGMTGPVITAGGDRTSHALRAQLEDLLALQRSDATPAELARVYAVCVTAYRAANLRAMVVSQVPFRVVDGRGEPVEDHPLNALFRDNLEIAEVLERSELTLCFWGHNLLYKRRRPRVTGVAGLEWLNPQLYRPHFDTRYLNALTGFDVLVRRPALDGADVPDGFISRADAVFMHGVDFDNDFGGVAPAEVAFDQAGVETEAAQTAVWFLRNRAVPAALLQPKEGGPETAPPSEAERSAMKRLLYRVLQGARNAGRTVVSSGRWEWVQLQAPFDDVGMETLTQTARESIAMAFDVPLDLLLPTSSTFAELYQTNRSWVEYFAKNRCRWYARQFNGQLVAEYGTGVRLEPDFSAVFRHDEREQVEVTNDQVTGGYLTLYEAQVRTGQATPDARLKDIYIVGGEPVHVERLVQLAREGKAALEAKLQAELAGEQDEPAGSEDGQGQQADEEETPQDKLPSRPKTPRPKALPAPQGLSSALHSLTAAEAAPVSPDDSWLPDAVFKELRDCVRVVARRGAAYAFQPQTLPRDVVAYVRLLATLGGETDELLDAARSYWRDTAEVRAMKGYGEVEATYRETLLNLIRRAYSRQVGRTEFGDLGRAEISAAFEAAFKQGLHDAGVTVETLEPGEAAFVKEQAVAERRYWTHLANSVYDEVQAGVARLEEIRQAEGKVLGSFDEAQRLAAEKLAVKQALIRQRDAVEHRLTLWAQSLRRMYSQGQTSGQSNQMLRWTSHPGKAHCRTCAAADGQVHRASTWAARNLYPGSSALECVASAKGVPVCGCTFEVTTERAQGRIDRIPASGMKSLPDEGIDGDEIPVAPADIPQMEEGEDVFIDSPSHIDGDETPDAVENAPVPIVKGDEQIVSPLAEETPPGELAPGGMSEETPEETHV
jgi:phage portal protein BeeE